jgi:hypothetical protein
MRSKNAGSEESGGGASYGEVEDEDGDKLEGYEFDFASCSEGSDPAEVVAAARVDRSAVRALGQIAVLEARASAAFSREDGMNAHGHLTTAACSQLNYAEDVQSQRCTLYICTSSPMCYRKCRDRKPEIVKIENLD